MISTALGEISLVMILEKKIFFPVSDFVIKFHVASLKAGWCFKAKSRHLPGMRPFAVYAASKLKVPLPAIKSSRQ